MSISQKSRKIIILVISILAVVVFSLFLSCQDYYFFNLPEKPTVEFNDVKNIETITKSDILFLIDNSGSMAQEQDNLARNLEKFINRIVSAQNDFHIGIITTDVDYLPLDECPSNVCTNGMECIEAKKPTKVLIPGTKYCTKKCNTDADCPPYDTSRNSFIPSICVEIQGFEEGQKYCIPENNGRLRACKPSQMTCPFYNGEHPKVLTSKIKSMIGDTNFINIFKDNVKIGINGTGFEKGLSAIRMALDRDWKDPLTGKNLVDNENAGFLRPDARLTIIVLTDEEDCSYLPFDPSFNEDTNDRCYPNPNTCHPDCQPMQPDFSSTPACPYGAIPVEAINDSDYTKKGQQYCMKECSSPSDCSSFRWAKPQCGKVDGFDQSKNYCFCDFNEPIANPLSRFDSLIPTQEFINFLKELKGNAGVNMAVITGTKVVKEGEPAPNSVEECASVNGVACGGKRYLEVAKGLDKYFLDSICKEDFGETMIKIVDILIASNEVILGGKPSDPSCLMVKINNEDVERCEIPTKTCGSDAGGVDIGGGGKDEMTLEGCLSGASLAKFQYCDNNVKCVDKDNSPCVYQNIEDTLKKVCNPYFACRCEGAKDQSGNPVPCKRPIYWQYIPSECDNTNKDKVKFYGCGLGPGDKLQINALIGRDDGSGNQTCSVSGIANDAGK
ncbi:MAG: VWA domain-containing protein [Deltaproteobacteria bacterium]|nr:VWA domain-containing protein [Deltaproteobacteria bacterium]